MSIHHVTNENKYSLFSGEKNVKNVNFSNLILEFNLTAHSGETLNFRELGMCLYCAWNLLVVPRFIISTKI